MTSAVDLVLAVRRTPHPKGSVVLVARPGSPVVHLYAGPVTPSGRWVPRSGRTVCRAATRRLTVLERALGLLDDSGQRVCDRCVTRLASLSGRVTRPVNRDQHLAHYRGLTPSDLAIAVRMCRTVDETHRVGFVLALLHGPTPVRRPVEPSVRQAVFDLNAGIVAARRRLTAAARTPEEIELARQAREVQAHNDALVEKGRRKARRLDRLTEYQHQGRYLTSSERAEIGMTG